MQQESTSIRFSDQHTSEGNERRGQVDGKYEIRLLRPDEVVVDRVNVVQRQEIASHVKNLASAYDPALFGIGYVSLRADGRYYILDGQHRVAAALRKNEGATRVPFYVLHGLSIPEEAEWFDKLNAKKKRVDAISTFRVGVTARNPVNVEVAAILENFGLTCGANSADGYVSAISAVLDVYNGKVGGNQGRPVNGRAPLPQAHLLTRTLTVLTSAWGKERTAFDRVLLKGIAAFIQKHDTSITGARLAELLAKHETPSRLIGRIKSIRDSARKTEANAAIEVLEGLYNRRLTEDRRLS